MSAIIWVHADALSRHHPVFTEAPVDARVVYIWDAVDLARRNWSLKRCVFILECLADLDVEILQGGTGDVLAGLDADRIYTADTPDPYRRNAINALGATCTIVKSAPFVSVPDDTDMGRFFRFWNKAKTSALRPTQATPLDEGPKRD